MRVYLLQVWCTCVGAVRNGGGGGRHRVVGVDPRLPVGTGDAWVKESVKATVLTLVDLLRKHRRATWPVQHEAPPYRYVMVEGSVTLAPNDTDIKELATRSLGAETGVWYAKNTRDD